MTKLRYRIEGTDRPADFEDFTRFNDRLHDCIRRVHRSETSRGRLPRLTVSDLRIGSAVVEIEGDTALIDRVVDTIRSLKANDTPAWLSYADIRAFGELGTPLDFHTRRITIADMEIDRAFVEACTRTVAEAKESYGEVVGSLDNVNVHRKRQFRLYPADQDRGVPCDFTDPLYDDVHRALTKRVRVTGRVVRDPNGVTVDRVPSVESITIIEGDRPPLSKLIGLFADDPIDLTAESHGWE